MKKILILGAGTAGTMMANHLNKKLNKNEWSITIIDQYAEHYYQPGFLFIPFNIYSEKDVVKEKRRLVPREVNYIESPIEIIDADKNLVMLKNKAIINYDILIIATGCRIAPEETEGFLDGWKKNIFDFYTLDGAVALREKLSSWKGGKLVINFVEMPIKCPVAPLEFTFLADWYFTKKGIRESVDITYVTPLSGAFTKQYTSKVLGNLLSKKNINMVTDFSIDHVDNETNKLVSFDGKEVDFDLLVTIPTNMGDDVIQRSGLGDELNFVPTDKHTLQSKAHDNVFVIGDATDLPTSKAGSVAHFEAEILTKNILNYITNKPLLKEFDGHANCYIESGYNKAFLIDFNYDVEPVEGAFPFPILGPFPLLKESRVNHLGKMAFKHIYWHMLLKGIPIPGVPAKMSEKGKKLTEQTTLN